MYAITSGDADTLITHFVFDRSLAPSPEGQRWLSMAKQQGHEVRCLCSGKRSSPLNTRVGAGGVLHLYRAIGTENQHSPLCTHGDAASISQAYGAPAGSFIVKGDSIAVDLDLLMPDDEPSGDGCGEWQGGQRDHGVALRALMWLLFVLSELNLSYPERQIGDPWEALIYGASKVNVSRAGRTRSLADLLMTPVVASRNWQAKRNYAKLCGAAKTTKRVLVACLLPVFARDKDQRDIVDLTPELDLNIHVNRALLARAIGQGPFAMQRHMGGHAVLAFGCASVRMRKGESASARMNQLVLMPVGQGLMPLPTQMQVDGLAQSLDTDTFFGVQSGDDPMIAMRAGRLRATNHAGQVAAYQEARA